MAAWASRRSRVGDVEIDREVMDWVPSQEKRGFLRGERPGNAQRPAWSRSWRQSGEAEGFCHALHPHHSLQPKAYFGAFAVALAAYHSAKGSQTAGEDFLESLAKHLEGEPAGEFLDLISRASDSAARGEHVSEFAAAIGCHRGITGYMYHTLPCVMQTWLRHQSDFRSGLEDIISAGGDTDTTGAILGGIIGAGVGKSGIPEEFLQGIMEWPRSVGWMEQLGSRIVPLCEGDTTVTVQPLFVPGVLIRNVAFLIVVLAHGLRRLAPPY